MIRRASEDLAGALFLQSSGHCRMPREKVVFLPFSVIMNIIIEY